MMMIVTMECDDDNDDELYKWSVNECMTTSDEERKIGAKRLLGMNFARKHPSLPLVSRAEISHDVISGKHETWIWEGMDGRMGLRLEVYLMFSHFKIMAGNLFMTSTINKRLNKGNNNDNGIYNDNNSTHISNNKI